MLKRELGHPVEAGQTPYNRAVLREFAGALAEALEAARRARGLAAELPAALAVG